ncbi:MAG TPA: tripartite tricarboxylate transporter TctB family protein [Alphaproteobacteria bacterium]|nr:tripartite tricarboxylate transporter TctB family protein [Alphaproteobacteria bacterium]
MSKSQIATIVVALALIGVSVATIVVAVDFPDPMTLGAPGPARLPILYAVALCGISIALAVTTWVGRREPELRFGGSARALGLMAWTALYVLLIPKVGFLIASAPWLFFAARALGCGWRGSLVAAVALPAVIYLAFAMMLNVPLP